MVIEPAPDASFAGAASKLGVTFGIARQRLKVIFQKTGMGRQSSLVRLIYRGPAALLQAGSSDV